MERLIAGTSMQTRSGVGDGFSSHKPILPVSYCAMKIALFIILGLLVVCAGAWLIGFIFYRARMQHYVFAHQLLPSQMFAEPVAVLVPMVSATGFSPEGREHLLRFWEAAGEGRTGKDLVSPDALTYSMEVLGHPNSTAFFVTLPPPEKTTEAHFALMVFDAPGLCFDAVRHLRYFVLEHYGQKNGIPRTQLSEWTPKEDGSLKHVDHGTDTPPDKASFMAKVQQIIELSGSQPKTASES
jgi:hypothetical protein